MFMKLPKHATSVGYGGKEITPDRKGVVEVPDEAVEELKRHGLTPCGPPDPEEEKEEKGKKGKEK